MYMNMWLEKIQLTRQKKKIYQPSNEPNNNPL